MTDFENSEQIPPTEETTMEAVIQSLPQPVDLVTGEILQPGAIPESLVNDEELAKGYAFLRKHAQRINVELLLIRHGRREDFTEADIDLRQKSQETASKNGILFLENITEDTESQLALTDASNFLSAIDETKVSRIQAKLAQQTEDTFLAEIMSQITGTGVAIAYPDFLCNSTNIIDQALERAYEASNIRNLQEADFEASNPEQDEKVLNALPSFIAYRDWYFIGKIGGHLAKMAENNLSGEFPVDIKFLVGFNHVMVAEYLAILGANVTCTGKLTETDRIASDKLIRHIGNTTLRNQTA